MLFSFYFLYIINNLFNINLIGYFNNMIALLNMITLTIIPIHDIDNQIYQDNISKSNVYLTGNGGNGGNGGNSKDGRGGNGGNGGNSKDGRGGNGGNGGNSKDGRGGKGGSGGNGPGGNGKNGNDGKKI
ncbi:hypothetical protein [Fluviispira multicolorata]|uniref:hypothetical protein n=1 Tax=Fluviispira multicolorata TaxID=2654512 RepID=UPI001B87AEED|nr:hypothetical protein [Fluviispira multicolorata]